MCKLVITLSLLFLSEVIAQEKSGQDIDSIAAEELFEKVCSEAHQATLEYFKGRRNRAVKGFIGVTLLENGIDIQLILNDEKKASELIKLVSPSSSDKQIKQKLFIRKIYATGRSDSSSSVLLDNNLDIGFMRSYLYALCAAGKGAQALKIVDGELPEMLNDDAETRLQLVNVVADGLAANQKRIPTKLTNQFLTLSESIKSDRDRAYLLLSHLNLARFYEDPSSANRLIARIMPFSDSMLDTEKQKIAMSVFRLVSLATACVDANEIESAKSILAKAKSAKDHPHFSKLGGSFLEIEMGRLHARIARTKKDDERMAQQFELSLSKHESHVLGIERIEDQVNRFLISEWFSRWNESSLFTLYAVVKGTKLELDVLERLKKLALLSCEDRFFFELAIDFHLRMDKKSLKDLVKELEKFASKAGTQERKFNLLRSVSAIYHKTGEIKKRDQTLAQIQKKLVVPSNRLILESMAFDLIEFDQYKNAYKIIRQMENGVQKTLAVSKLAHAMAKSLIPPPMKNQFLDR